MINENRDGGREQFSMLLCISLSPPEYFYPSHEDRMFSSDHFFRDSGTLHKNLVLVFVPAPVVLLSMVSDRLQWAKVASIIRMFLKNGIWIIVET